MKLEEYIKKLVKLAEERPNLKVVYSSDEEGNCFKPVCNNPSLGNYACNDFIPDDGTEEFKENYKINCVCIN